MVWSVMSVICSPVSEGEKTEKLKKLKQRRKDFLPNFTKTINRGEMYFTNHTSILKEIRILKEGFVFAFT